MEITDPRLPYNYPEKRSPAQQSRERIQRAAEMFDTHFKQNGKPKTEEGKRLTKKYEIRVYRYPGFFKRLYSKLKYKLRNVLS
jgi:hypothetical protein